MAKKYKSKKVKKQKNIKINSNKNSIYKNSIYINIESKKSHRKSSNQPVKGHLPIFQPTNVQYRPLPMVEIKQDKYKSPVLEKTEIENMINSRLKVFDKPIQDKPIQEEPTQDKDKEEIQEEPIQEEPEYELEYIEYKKIFEDKFPNVLNKIVPYSKYKDKNNFKILSNQISEGTYNLNKPTIRKNRLYRIKKI